MTSDISKANYEMRYRRFIREMNKIGRMMPRDLYLYKIMDGVPFKDLGTAIMMAQIDYAEAGNDNKGKR